MFNLKFILTMRCEEASRLASDALDRKLSLSERLALRAHTYICRSCRRVHAQLQMLREFLDQMPSAWRSRLSDAPRLSPERRRRIEQLLTEAYGND